MPGTLSCHAPSRDLVKLPLYERNQSVEGGLVALTPFQQQSGGVRGVVRNVAILSLFDGCTVSQRLPALQAGGCHAFHRSISIWRLRRSLIALNSGPAASEDSPH